MSSPIDCAFNQGSEPGRNSAQHEQCLFVVTATLAYRLAAGGRTTLPPPADLADALMDIPDVVTVRVRADATVTYRVDVHAATYAAAESQAAHPARIAGDALGVEVEIASVTAVTDAERIAAFEYWSKLESCGKSPH